MKTFNEFCVEAYQLDEFLNPKELKSKFGAAKTAVTSNPVYRAVTNNPVTRTGGRIMGGLNKASGILSKVGSVPGLIDPQARPSQKAVRGLTMALPPGAATVSATMLTPAVDNSKWIEKNIDKPIQDFDTRVNKKIDNSRNPMLNRSLWRLNTASPFYRAF